MSGMATYTPGMEITGGSLAHGLGIAVGACLGLKRKSSRSFVYNLLSDGELDEGSTWEAALSAGHHKLDNLIAIVDVNNDASGRPFDQRAQLRAARGEDGRRSAGTRSVSTATTSRRSCGLRTARSLPEPKPRVIICDTKMAKGVPFLEPREMTHFLRVDPHEWTHALETLDAGRKHEPEQPKPGAQAKPGENAAGAAVPKKRLTTSAMIASLAAEGQARSPPRSATRSSKLRRTGRNRGDDSRSQQIHGFARIRRGVPGPLLSDGNGGAAPDDGGGRDGARGLRAVRNHLRRVRLTPGLRLHLPGDRRGATRTSKSAAPCPASPPATARAIRRRRTSRSFAAMPNLTIIDPCDALDIEQAVPAMAAHNGPVYMRLLRGNVPACSTNTATASSSAGRS